MSPKNIFLMWSIPIFMLTTAETLSAQTTPSSPSSPSNQNHSQIPKPNTSATIDLKPINRPTKRPKAPTAQYIYCVYDAGYLNINFSIPEGNANLIVDTTIGSCLSCMFDTNSLSEIYIGEYTEALITISTEYGHTYEGILSLE